MDRPLTTGSLVLRPTPEDLIATLSDDELVALDHLLAHQWSDVGVDLDLLARIVPNVARRSLLGTLARQVDLLGTAILPRDRIDPATIERMERDRQLAIEHRKRREEGVCVRAERLSRVYRRPWSARLRPATLGVYHRVGYAYNMQAACGQIILDELTGVRLEDVSPEIRCRHPRCRQGGANR